MLMNRTAPADLHVPIETLHLAHATTDVIEEHRDALALTTARLLADERDVELTAATAAELISLLLTLASSSTASRWDSSATLRHAAEDEGFRCAVERAFLDACRAELATPASAIVGRAWTDLLRAYLSWLPA